MGENSPDGLTAAQRAAKWRAIDQWLGDMRLAVVPLYADQGNRVPKHGGCAVAVRIGDDIALLTAGHVYDGFAEQCDGRMAAATNSGFVPLPGRVVRSRRDQSGDPVDAAVIVLDRGPEADKLGAYAFTWRATDVALAVESGTDLLLFGYPHKDAERTDGRKVTPRRYFWEAKVGTVADYSRNRVAPEERVVGHVPISQGVDERGRVVRSIRPSGVSGSGMWILGSDPPRLLSIFTHASSDDEFIGTLVTAHALLLRRHFPAIFQVFVSSAY